MSCCQKWDGVTYGVEAPIKTWMLPAHLFQSVNGSWGCFQRKVELVLTKGATSCPHALVRGYFKCQDPWPRTLGVAGLGRLRFNGQVGSTPGRHYPEQCLPAWHQPALWFRSETDTMAAESDRMSPTLSRRRAVWALHLYRLLLEDRCFLEQSGKDWLFSNQKQNAPLPRSRMLNITES